MRGRWELSDAQWQLIDLRPRRRADGRGRPWQDTRAVLNGILWVLGTGAQWRERPDIRRTRLAIAASSSGCGRASWSASCGLWRRSCKRAENCSWRRPLSTPPSPGQKRGLAVGPTKGDKGTKIIALNTAQLWSGFPLAIQSNAHGIFDHQILT
jgi:transposase